MTIENLHQLFLDSEGVTTDTRNLKKGGLFFALKGASFNGNLFAVEALEAGCKYAVVDEDLRTQDDRIIKVDNVLETLQQLAGFHRKQFDIPVIGITGSNGKTTTKELAGAVLSEKFNTLVTSGNLNNHLGVPFTLLRLTAEHQMAIIEMGANKPGDIKELAEIAEPTHGIITNIGAAHIEGFGSLQGVIDTKTELYNFIAGVNGVLFVNAEDDTLIQNLPEKIETCTYGEFHGDYRGELGKQDPLVEFSWFTGGYKSPLLKTNLVGKYNFVNFLSAIAIGSYFEVEPNLVNKAIENYLPTNNRSQITKTEHNTLVVDCYNANATSMRAALESFVEMEAPYKLAVLGDMLELGEISEEEHQKVVDFVEKHAIKTLLVGDEMMKTTTRLKKYENWEALSENEELDQIKKHLILLKGSRGIKLENLISFL